MPLARYARAPKCACGGRLYEDRHRASGRERGRTTCSCDHYHFPHRRGSLFCRHGAVGQRGISFYERGNAAIASLVQQYRAFGALEAAA